MFSAVLAMPTDDRDGIMDYICSNYLRDMRAFAARYLDNASDVDDAVYETLSRLYFSRVTIENIETKRGRNFVLTAVKNTCYDFLRKRQKENMIYFDDEEQIENQISHAPDACDYTVDDICDAIGELDEKYRDVLIMSAVHGLSSRKIGKTLGISERTIRNRLSKAREKLLVILKERGIYI